jgi:hypothetical protein
MKSIAEYVPAARRHQAGAKTHSQMRKPIRHSDVVLLDLHLQ